MIRGSDPSPGAGSTFGENSIRFFRASKSDGDAGGAPGRSSITEEGFRIAANGGSIFVGRVQQGRDRVNAPEWIEAVGLKAGDIRGLNS